MSVFFISELLMLKNIEKIKNKQYDKRYHYQWKTTCHVLLLPFISALPLKIHLSRGEGYSPVNLFKAVTFCVLVPMQEWDFHWQISFLFLYQVRILFSLANGLFRVQ